MTAVECFCVCQDMFNNCLVIKTFICKKRIKGLADKGDIFAIVGSSVLGYS